MLACELARRGIRHVIIDKLDNPNTASRGKGLQPRSLEVLDDLGIASSVLSTGQIKLPLRLYDVEGSWIDREPVTTAATVATPYPELVWIAEFDVEGSLRRRLEEDGSHIHFGTTATGFVEGPDDVTVNLDGLGGPAVVRARWVVGADGGRSIVRKSLGIPFDGVTKEVSYYLGDIQTLDLDRGRQHLWASESGMLALTPLPGSALWQFQCGIPDPSAELDQPSLALYQKMIDDRAGVGRVRLTDAAWLSLYRANVRLAKCYRAGRILLAGDAAHTHPPAGGQGMNTGLQDAYNLGWKIAAVICGSDSTLLDTYEQERRPVAQAMVKDAAARSRRVRAGVSGNAAQVAGAIRGVTDDTTTGLQIAYPHSALSHDGRGCRTPFVTGLRGPGFAGSTYDLLRGPHWTAFAFTDIAELDLDGFPYEEVHLHRFGVGAICDPDDSVKAAFGVENNTLILIRPDGHSAMALPLNAGPVLPGGLAPILASRPLSTTGGLQSRGEVQDASAASLSISASA
jgi:2-polyprenyl-6-methoxyphenol hydroxylase-like FAD-dependent oxidoreductase